MGCPAAGAPTAPGQDPKKCLSLKPPRNVWAALKPVLVQHQARTKKRLSLKSPRTVGAALQPVLSQHQARTQKTSLPEASQDCVGCPAAGARTAPGQDPKNLSLKPPKTMWAALQPVHLQHQARTKKRLPEVSQDCEGCPAASALTAPGQDPKSVSP